MGDNFSVERKSFNTSHVYICVHSSVCIFSTSHMRSAYRIDGGAENGGDCHKTQRTWNSMN